MNEIRLPEMIGSPKQIAWAEDIRAGYIRQFHFVEDNIDIIDRKGEKTIESERMRNKVFGCYTILNQQLLSSIDEDGFLIDAWDIDKSIVENVKNILRKTKDIFETNSSAKWWIDHRTR